MKICLVGSSGGHLTHLLLLESFIKKHERVWVTFKKEDAISALKDEKTYWCYYPTNKNIWNLIRNTFLAFKVLRKEKPDIIISSGAAVAIPFFFLGKKIFKKKTVFIEVYDRIDNPTTTAKAVKKYTDLFVVQWDEQQKNFEGSVNLGGIF